MRISQLFINTSPRTVAVTSGSIQIVARDRDKSGFVVEADGETTFVHRRPMDTYVSTLCGLRVGVSNER